jgi:hypothetical protein
MATAVNPNIKPVHVIDLALTKIERDGWTQGRAKDEYGRYCISGACAEAARALHADFLAHREATRIVTETATGRYDKSLTAWNDSPHRTKYDVINVLRSALSRAISSRR